ncbi:hypothetical protein [Burkholderia sp. NFPP32]|uniref:hypothetical protein n=1 Tax=Burkholderia sp. NFPP32 TaxID=1566267 RepID=UPI001C43227A|nr:hypothetical protein [Burkholderia sp. NFPP32]
MDFRPRGLIREKNRRISSHRSRSPRSPKHFSPNIVSIRSTIDSICAMEKHNFFAVYLRQRCRLHLHAIKIAAINVRSTVDTGVAKYQQMAKSLSVTKYPYLIARNLPAPPLADRKINCYAFPAK